MNANKNSWGLNRQINISVFIQLVLLAGLIVGTWVSLQNKLVLLQRDVDMLIETNTTFQQKLESLTQQTIACEYRIAANENKISKIDN